MASTPIDVDFASTDKNLFDSLEKMIGGCPLPCNVIKDVNPHNYLPSNLPDGVWYLVCSKENTRAQDGQWKAKAEACEIFSNSVIIGWRTTLEFYEGQFPHEHKTDWVMQEFRITQKILTEDKKEEDSSSLCRVFLSGKQSPNHEKQQKTFSANITSETHSHSTQVSFENNTRLGSTSRHEANDDNETRTLAVMERPINHPEDNLPETDIFSEDDFLELRDLDQPVSPSSSSDNSSCMTMSSDEYFDPEALLRELEPKKTEGVVPENAGYKYSFSTPQAPNEVVMSQGSLFNIERSKPKTEEPRKSECAMLGSTMVNGGLRSKVSKQVIRGQEANQGDEGPSSNSRNLTSSSHAHIALQNGENKAIVGRMKKFKRKCCCFMPF